jgi:(2Fe-2S) ferredoxin
MKEEKVPYQRMIFVCTNDDPDENRPACGLQGSMAICKAIKEEVKKRGLKGKVRALKSGCMDLCEKGPNVMVFPESVLHSGVTLGDIPLLVEKYLH